LIDGGTLILADDTPREIITGSAGQLHRIVDQAPVRFASRQAFDAFADPQHEKLFMSLRVTETGVPGESWLVLEHATLALSDDAERRFRQYWHVIKPTGAFVSRRLLKAVRRLAQQAEGAAGVERSGPPASGPGVSRARPVEATPAEHVRQMPGDDVIADPIDSLTHAITIGRPPRDVWPWIAQMGADRAGWYSYDRLDNGGRPSATRILPELQQLTIGMTFPALPGRTDGFTLLAFEPARSLVLGWAQPAGPPMVTWAFVLEDTGDGGTRLIVRARGGQDYTFHGLPKWIGGKVIEFVHYLMERRQLLGIAKRAEQR
jgi:hypothetical protein